MSCELGFPCSSRHPPLRGSILPVVRRSQRKMQALVCGTPSSKHASSAANDLKRHGVSVVEVHSPEAAVLALQSKSVGMFVISETSLQNKRLSTAFSFDSSTCISATPCFVISDHADLKDQIATFVRDGAWSVLGMEEAGAMIAMRNAAAKCDQKENIGLHFTRFFAQCAAVEGTPELVWFGETHEFLKTLQMLSRRYKFFRVSDYTSKPSIEHGMRSIADYSDISIVIANVGNSVTDDTIASFQRLQRRAASSNTPVLFSAPGQYKATIEQNCEIRSPHFCFTLASSGDEAEMLTELTICMNFNLNQHSATRKMQAQEQKSEASETASARPRDMSQLVIPDTDTKMPPKQPNVPTAYSMKAPDHIVSPHGRSPRPSSAMSASASVASSIASPLAVTNQLLSMRTVFVTGSMVSHQLRELAPPAIRREFESAANGRLHVTDDGFRRIVKDECNFPAYFGLVLFQRMVQYHDALCLAKGEEIGEPITPPPNFKSKSRRRARKAISAHSQFEHRTVSLEDFMRFWTPDLQQGDRVERFLALITPPDHECSSIFPELKRLQVSAAQLDSQSSSVQKTVAPSRKMYRKKQGAHRIQWKRHSPARVTMPDMAPLVHALVDRHPDLAHVRWDATLRERYVVCTLAAIFSSLHGQCTGSISRAEVRESNLVDAFYLCATSATKNVLPFSTAYFAQMHDSFKAIDTGNKGIISIDALKTRSTSTKIADTVLERIFSGVARPLTCAVKGHMSFEDFVWFSLAQSDRMYDTSINYWLRCLDLDDDGKLSVLDLECAYENRTYQLRTMGERNIMSTNDAMCQIMDLVTPEVPGFITVMDIRRAGTGPVLYDLMISLNTGTSAKNYLM